MKKLLFILFTVLATNVIAQSDLSRGHHTSDGFYTSMSVGVSPLFVNDKVTTGGSGIIKVVGGAGGINIRLGAPVKENLVLHADLMAFVSGALSVRSGGSDDCAISETKTVVMRIYGAGTSYYFMPSNIFMSGTVGLGAFEINDDLEEINTQMGLGLIARVGKDWWIGTNWDMGISIEMAYVWVNDVSDAKSEVFSGTSLSVSWNFTFN